MALPIWIFLQNMFHVTHVFSILDANYHTSVALFTLGAAHSFGCGNAVRLCMGTSEFLWPRQSVPFYRTRNWVKHPGPITCGFGPRGGPISFTSENDPYCGHVYARGLPARHPSTVSHFPATPCRRYDSPLSILYFIFLAKANYGLARSRKVCND